MEFKLNILPSEEHVRRKQINIDRKVIAYQISKIEECLKLDLELKCIQSNDNPIVQDRVYYTSEPAFQLEGPSLFGELEIQLEELGYFVHLIDSYIDELGIEDCTYDYTLFFSKEAREKYIENDKNKSHKES